MITLLSSDDLPRYQGSKPWRSITAPTHSALVAMVRADLDAGHESRQSAWVWLVQHANAALTLVDRVASEDERLYPPIHIKTPLPRGELRVSGDWIAGYRELVRLHEAELILLLGVPRDTDPAALENALIALAAGVKPLVRSAPDTIPTELVAALIANQHATHSQRQQLAHLCQRHHALFNTWPVADHVKQSSVRETIATLEQRIQDAPTVYR